MREREKDGESAKVCVSRKRERKVSPKSKGRDSFYLSRGKGSERNEEKGRERETQRKGGN